MTTAQTETTVDMNKGPGRPRVHTEGRKPVYIRLSTHADLAEFAKKHGLTQDEAVKTLLQQAE